MCSLIIVLFNIYEGESKSKVKLYRHYNQCTAKPSICFSKYILSIVVTSDCQV